MTQPTPDGSMNKLRVLDLFAGIGGFSLGLERTGGFETVAFCEIDPFCQKVLAKHWPGVPIYDDIRNLTSERLATDGIRVDVITGGFPCQDISFAGAGAGLAGERSGLWSEISRLVGELRSQYLIVENVAALLGRGLGNVLGDLAEIGYDAELHCIPASAVGASQERDRIWIIADSAKERASRLLTSKNISEARFGRKGGAANLQRLAASPFEPGDSHPQPLIRGVARGIPCLVDRVGACGNSVDPAIPEMIGRAILQAQHDYTQPAE